MKVGEFDEASYIGVPYASWENWNPREYLDTYFKKLGPDSIETYKFLIREIRYISKKMDLSKSKVLDFGAGPTIFAAALIGNIAGEIHLADYLFSNLNEIKNWINKRGGHFNWDELVKTAIKMEGGAPTRKSIQDRQEQIRSKARLFRCDASLDSPLGTNDQYPLVISTFCADSATSSKKIWKSFQKNILSLVDVNGYILISALRKCTYYKNGDEIFPCANISERDFKNLFKSMKNKFSDIKIETCEVPECTPEGFSSLIFIRAKRIS